MSRDVYSYSRLCRPSQLQSHLSEMATASKRKRLSYDAAFKLHAENSNNYAAGGQFGVPTTYTRVNDFGQHMDSIFRGAIYTWERLIGEYIRYAQVTVFTIAVTLCCKIIKYCS